MTNKKVQKLVDSLIFPLYNSTNFASWFEQGLLKVSPEQNMI